MQLPDIAWLNLPSGPLAYRRGGEGPPLLLIHGWGGSSRYWMGAFATLAEHYDVIALDMPGFGESPPPRGSTKLSGLTESMLAAVDALGLKQLSVGGHSLGASVALLMAALRPEQIERIILASFGLPRSSIEAQVFAGMHCKMSVGTAFWAPIMSFWEPWFAYMRPWTQLAWMIPPFPMLLASQVVHQPSEVSYLSMALGASDLAAMNARVAMESASSAGDPTVIAAAKQVRVPALVLSGREDPLFPPTSVTALANTLSNAELVLLDNCGHVPMVECPVPFYARFSTFLA